MTSLWPGAPATLRLSPRHIDIWCSRLDLPEEAVAAFAALLSRDEIQRARRFAFPDKYREYVVTRGLLRRSLARASGLNARSLQFDYSAHKKPHLKASNIAFNVSHSHGYALLALGLDRNIGVDIEKIRPETQCEKLARRFFSAAEYSALMRLAGPARRRAFYTLWTRKEALVKALGTGIALDLREFDVRLEAGTPAFGSARPAAAAAASWKMANIAVNQDYLAALATDGAAFELRYWRA